MCKITHNMWNRIIQRFLLRSVWKKFPSLEKFYTNAVGGVGDNYEVCLMGKPSNTQDAIKYKNIQPDEDLLKYN